MPHNDTSSSLPPNPRDTASFLSKLTFWWLHPLLLKGYRKSIEKEDLYKVQESDESSKLGDLIVKQWEDELVRSKRLNRKPSYLRTLIRTFGIPYLVCGLLGFIEECFCRIAQPLFIIGVIRYHSNDLAETRTVGFVCCLMITVTAVLHIFTYHPFNFQCRHLVLQIKAATSAIIFRKTLRLSATSLSTAKVGELVSLLSNDLEKFDASVNFLHYIWIGPLQTVITTVILWYLIGPSCLAGILLILLFGPLQTWIAGNLFRLRKATSNLTASRVSLTDEVMKAIRGIKMHVWELPFKRKIEEARKAEIDMILRTNYFRAINITLAFTSSKVIVFLSLIVYVLTGNILSAEKVFVTSSLINNIRLGMTQYFPYAISKGSETLVSCRKIQRFLELGEKPEESVTEKKPKSDSKDDEYFVEVVKITARWNPEAPEDALRGVSFSVRSGQVMGVSGPVGAGKSSLLLALLRELPLQEGHIKVRGRISYAPQEPWLFAGSVRDNVLFGQSFDPKRYFEVIRVCGLEEDLRMLPDSDGTAVGERGFSISGGQKARINLARAMYYDADVYLLDDPLSAVDTHVGKQIFEQCIKTFLKNKVTILVTHQLQFLENVNHSIILDNGRVEAEGTYNQLKNKEINMTFVKEKDSEQLKAGENLIISRKEETINQPGTNFRSRGTSVSLSRPKSEMPSDGRKQLKMDYSSLPKSFLLFNLAKSYSQDIKKKTKSLSKGEAGGETKRAGAIRFKVYLKYFGAGGKPAFLALLVLLNVAAQVVFSFSDYFLSQWTNKEELLGKLTLTGDFVSYRQAEANHTFLQSWISESFNRNDFIWIYSGLTLSLIAFASCRSILFFHISRNASKKLHNRMLDAILQAPMRFFEVRPSGQILNRFSKEMGQVDDFLPETIHYFLNFVFNFAGIVLLILYLNVWFLLPTIALGFVFLALRRFYLSSSRELKRLERITKSPVFTEISAALNGLASIRAFKAQNYVTSQFDRHQNLYSSTSFLFLSSTRIFGAALDILSAVYISIVSFNFMFQKDIHGGEVGLGISMALMLSGLFQWGVRQSAEIENQMTSVESVLEYSKIDSENDDAVEKAPKAPNWPSKGKIVFRNVNLKYNKDDSPVLKDINFTIKPSEKIGIVGRTGAGKSSLLSCLCRLASPEGRIAIDEAPTDTLLLKDLRSSLSIIPQDPILLSGTLRENLDPFSEFEDDRIWGVLEETQLKETVSQMQGKLNFEIVAGGSNLSVGQRQLVCLARAVLKHNKILIMDEATASVDHKTDDLIQKTIRSKFADCTVLTIAHRLHTIIDCDRIMVIEEGKLVEFDSPMNLINKPNSTFLGLISLMGPDAVTQLKMLARKAHERKRDSPMVEESDGGLNIKSILPSENGETTKL